VRWIITKLPRSWRLTEAEALTLDSLVGVASRRLKVERNMLTFDREPATEDKVFRLAVINETIRILDSVRGGRR